MFLSFEESLSNTCTLKIWLCFAGLTRVWIFTVTLWELDAAVRQIPDDILVCADFLHLNQTLGKKAFRGNFFLMEIEIKQTCFRPDGQSWCGGSGWTIMATMWLLSATNNEWAFFNPEAYGSTSQKITLDHGFSFHTPRKPWLFFLSFTPSKLLSDLKAPQQSSGYDFHFKIYGDPFEDLHIKCSAELLLWLHKRRK